MDKQQIPETLRCKQVRVQFAQFLSSALDPESRGRVRGHVLSCRACALALSQATAESMTPELTAKFSRPMPRPPEAALKALGAQQTKEGTLWTGLQALAAGPAEWAKAEWDNIYTAVQQWLQELVSVPSPAFATRGTRSGVDNGWPQQINVRIIDSSGQLQGRTVCFEVIEPPTVTPAGEFVCVLRTDEVGFVSWSLQCTVAVGATVKVTFAGELQPEVDNWGWKVWIETEGLPANKEPVVIPSGFVQWSLQEQLQ